MIHQLTLTGRGIGTGSDRRHPTPGVLNHPVHPATPRLRRLSGATEPRRRPPVRADHIVQRQHPATIGRRMRRAGRTSPARGHTPDLSNTITPGPQTVGARPATGLRRRPIQAPRITKLAHLRNQPIQRHGPQYVRSPPQPANTSPTFTTRAISDRGGAQRRRERAAAAAATTAARRRRCRTAWRIEALTCGFAEFSSKWRTPFFSSSWRILEPYGCARPPCHRASGSAGCWVCRSGLITAWRDLDQ
jgi:hypothetical protein